MINFSADGEDATERCNPDNPMPKQHTSPQAQDHVGLSKAAVLVRTARCKSLPRSSAARALHSERYF